MSVVEVADDGQSSPEATRWLPLLGAILIMGLVVVIYWPGLSGGFMFDDIPNILENPRVLINAFGWRELQQAMWSSDAGLLHRPVAMLSFALNHLWTGGDAYWYKLTNLIIHLLSGAGLFFLSRLLLLCRERTAPGPANWIALFVAAAWLLHPFNLTTVLYIVQRMNGLAALFSIWAMVAYVAARHRQIHGRAAWLQFSLSALFVLLAVFSKENGVLVLPMLFLMEWIVLGFATVTQAQRRRLQVFFVLTVLLPGLLVAGFIMVNFDWLLSGYEGRDFSLYERILTEARVLFFYIEMTLLPDLSMMGLYHDDFQLSTGLTSPWWTWLACGALFSLLLAALAARKRYPFVSFGILFFLAGHIMESTVLPLELVHEHRNYLPSFGMVFALFSVLLPPARRRFAENGLPRLLLSVAIVAVLAVNTSVRARIWSNQVDLALVSVRHHPDSARSNNEAGSIFFILAGKGGPNADKYFEKARRFYRAGSGKSSNMTMDFALLMLDDRQGLPLDKALLERMIGTLETAPLHSSSVSSLVKLAKCQLEEVCHFQPETLARLFNAMLKNPRLSLNQRAQLLTLRVQHAMNIGDYPTARDLAKEITGLTPDDPQVQLNYAEILMALGQFKAARTHIRLAERYDTDRYYQEKIAAQTSRVNDFEAAQDRK